MRQWQSLKVLQVTNFLKKLTSSLQRRKHIALQKNIREIPTGVKYFKIICRANMNNPLCSAKMNLEEQIPLLPALITQGKSIFLMI